MKKADVTITNMIWIIIIAIISIALIVVLLVVFYPKLFAEAGDTMMNFLGKAVDFRSG